LQNASKVYIKPEVSDRPKAVKFRLTKKIEIFQNF
jgi:hypothetical protein